jgi:hypothetical protein
VPTAAPTATPPLSTAHTQTRIATPSTIPTAACANLLPRYNGLEHVKRHDVRVHKPPAMRTSRRGFKPPEPIRATKAQAPHPSTAHLCGEMVPVLRMLAAQRKVPAVKVCRQAMSNILHAFDVLWEQVTLAPDPPLPPL